MVIGLHYMMQCLEMNRDTLQKNPKRLSIQLSSDGFSFCVYNSQNNLYELLKTVLFSYKATSPTALLQEVKSVFENEETLHNSFNEVLLIHHNNLNTFVPQAYFDERVLNNYLEHSVKTFDNDFVTFDVLESLKANNVYIPFVNINNFIFDSFGCFTYLHSSTVFIENILKSKNIYEKEMFVNVYKNDFQCVVIENNELILSNHFTHATKEDFVYYILFVAEQLKMNPNEFNLTLYGEIEEEFELYQLLYRYVRNVEIYAKLNTNLGLDIHCLPQKHFNLLQLHL